jgi:sortase (surface protein transpeptidase)
LEKETAEGHIDKENLKQAQKEMENVVKHTNEVKRLQEALMKRVELDEKLDWDKYQVSENTPKKERKMEKHSNSNSKTKQNKTAKQTICYLFDVSIDSCDVCVCVCTS